MYTDLPAQERDDAVATGALARKLLAPSNDARLSQELRVAAQACLEAAEALVTAIDAYGQVCQQLGLEAFTVAELARGAAAGEEYEAKRDAYLAVKAAFLFGQ